MIGIKVLLKCVKYLQSMVVGVGNQTNGDGSYSQPLDCKKGLTLWRVSL